MSGLARESLNEGGSPIPVVGQGTTTVITVGVDAAVAYIAIGSAPDATVAGARVPITPNIAEYFRAVPGVSKVSALAGATNNVMGSAVSADTTVIRVYYNAGAGQVSVMEGLK